jgi:hypothetical protein
MMRRSPALGRTNRQGAEDARLPTHVFGPRRLRRTDGSTTLSICHLLIAGCCLLTHAPSQAQTPPPQQAPSAQQVPAEQTQPAQPTPTPQQAQPAQQPAPTDPVRGPQPQPVPPPPPAAAPQPVPQQHTLAEGEARRLAAEHWRARAQLAQARAERARARRADEREPAPRAYGDAGAALAVGVSLDTPWYTDPGFDVFHDDDVTTRLGVWAAYDVLSLQPDLIMAAELGWGRENESENGLRGGALRSELETHAFFAGAQLRWVPLGMLQPYARLAGGAARVDMELHAAAPAQSFADDAVSPFGSLGLGVLVRTPTRMFENRRGNYASLSFGLMLEGGYTLAAPVELQLDGRGPGERDIALIEADLGELSRSGPYARVSWIARF